MAYVVDENQEMRLDENTQERLHNKQLEELYSLMKACELLENAFIRDAVPAPVYTSQCMAILGKFDQALKLAQSSGAVGDIREFMRSFGFRLPAAEKRLLEEKVPATSIHMQGGGDGRQEDTAAVMDLVAQFITLMDALSIGCSRPEQIMTSFLLLNQLLSTFTVLPADWQGRARMSKWLSELRSMNATDELGAVKLQNMKLDVETTLEEVRHAVRQRGRLG